MKNMKDLIACCVAEKGFDTCGDCKELEHCQIVGAVLNNAPDAKKILTVSKG
jgi:hypothetical protein